MNKSSLSAFAVVVSSLVGCAASDQEPAQGEQLGSSVSELTVADCDKQLDKCLKDYPVFGVFTCPAQHAQCALSAEDGVPAQVAAAVASVASCRMEADKCIAATPTGAAGCRATQAECVAAVVGVELPAIVDGTAACVDGVTKCIDGASRTETLAECANNYSKCAIDQASTVLPAPVGQVVGDTNACRIALDSCIAVAETPDAINKCAGENATCIGKALGVLIPKPVKQAVACADKAGECAVAARSVADVTKCQDDLRLCNADIVGSVEVPPQLSCEQKWTACMARTPFGFISCGAELAKCSDSARPAR
ncbi:MAG TPA: hypothetical protein VI299_19350 [Polyangiales bacterium]